MTTSNADSSLHKPSCTTNNRTPSLISSVLPTALSSRIPMISSLRSTLQNSLPLTLSRNSPVAPQTYAYEIETPTSSGASTPNTRPSTPEELATSATSNAFPIESRNVDLGGVDWNTAYTGANIWANAWRRLSEPHQNPSAVRAMHIDAVRYMHMALPDDLTPSEIDSLRQSLVTKIPNSERQILPYFGSESAPQNALRNSVSQVVCMFIAVAIFALPLLMSFLDRAVKYERQHGLSDKLVKQTQKAARSVGNMSVDVGHGAVKFKNSPLGTYLFATSVWAMQSVLAGVNDGLTRSKISENPRMSTL